MGQYLQLGICHSVTVDKEQLKQHGLAESDVAMKLGEKMDMALFTCHEAEETVRFTLRESIVLEQLHDFLQGQYSMYPAEGDQFNPILIKLSKMQSMQEIVELAERQTLQHFQNNSIYEYIEAGPWNRVRLRLSLFVFFIEGKILMEGYNYFLGYLENMVRSNSQYPIAGAFRAVIQ
ncbi:hypothetical protein OIN60_06365 [Paenibacillus sp. P96]|uniref:Uncharacterized protein n=1 Tax=Paenibacillus zeirhizosphaerae TaxID=2987519 RepID=A0ABT9FNT2_9BACL|nr:hypothetical protein [Paenibacillus sp. P96]MDP4096391.1 hypothetical protein [Paenibacillus sp. P96]